MRYWTIEQLETNDNLSKLFNQYLKQLSTMDMVSHPRDSMKAHQKALTNDRQMQYRLETFYALTTLSNSLYCLHRDITGALKLLREYRDEFEFDWLHYATVERSRSIQEYGSEDDEDYNEDGSVKFKEDKKSLRGHTIHDRLDQFFEGKDNDSREERIGTSHPFDFMFYTDAVRRSSEFCPFKMINKFYGKELPIYNQNSEGEMKPMSLGDKVEREINEDLTNGYTAELFNVILLHGMEAASMYHKIKRFSNSKEDYEKLIQALEIMLNVDYNYPQ